jgi:hypothetical protein
MTYVDPSPDPETDKSETKGVIPVVLAKGDEHVVFVSAPPMD